MKKEKKRVKIKNVLKLLLIILIIGFFGYLYANKKITNIYVTGNDILKEQTLIELAGLEEYPKIYKVSPKKIKKQLLASPFIEKVSVEKSFFGKVTINIKEYNILCKTTVNQPSSLKEQNDIVLKNDSNKLILSSGKIIDYLEDILGVPILINQVDNNVYYKFIKGLNKIDKDIALKISEIKYDPNELDDERFLLYMTDQIYVYVTLSKIEVINTYNEIVSTLSGKKGILYLDSGNHFQIKK